MSSLTKIVVSVLALGVAAQILAGGLFPSGNALPSHLAYLKALAREDDRRIVILLTGKTWNDPCRELETDVIRTWEWSRFSRQDIVFENFDYAIGGQTNSIEMRHLREKFAGEGFPVFIVAASNGSVLGWRTGHDLKSPAAYKDWIRSL